MSAAGAPGDLLAHDIAGRGPERARLRALLAASAAGARVAALVGEAGMGKTRLAAAVADQARGEGRRVLEGRAMAAEAGLPLGLVHDALRSAGGEEPDDPIAAAFPRLLLPAALGGMGGEVPDRAVLNEASARWVRWAAGDGGLVVVLEDVHLGDPSSLALVQHLVRAARDAPVLWVLTFRPEDAEPGTPIGALRRELARSRSGEELALGPLGRADVAAMLEDMLGVAPPADAVDAVSRLSGGNPFVVEELVRDAVETGALDAAAGRWPTTGWNTLPWTLRDMMRERLDRLDPDDHELLRWAAVLGERFDVDLLAAVAGRDPGDVVAPLARLRRAGLVDDDPAAPGRGMRFRHALTLVAVTGELIGADRRRRHARVLAAADEGAEVPLDELLAHALGAGDRARALALSLDAARRSLELAGSEEAEAHLARALELWRPEDGPAVRAEALLRMGRLVIEAHHHPRAAGYLEEAVRRFEEAGDPAGALSARVRLLQTRWRAGDTGVPVELEALLAGLPAGTPPGSRREVLELIARLAIMHGDMPRAIEGSEAAMALLPPGAPAALRAPLLNVVGAARMLTGDQAGGRAALQECARVAAEAGDPVQQALALGNVCACGRVDAPTPLEGLAASSERGLAVAGEYGLATYEAWLALGLSDLRALQGDPAGAAAALARAEAALAVAPPSPQEAATVPMRQGEIALLEGRLEDADRLLADARERTEAAGHLGLANDCCRWLAQARLALGDAAGAVHAVGPALAALARHTSLVPTMGSALVPAAVAGAVLGDAGAAGAVAGLLAAHAPGPRADVAAALHAVAGGGVLDGARVEAACAEVEATGRHWEAAWMRLAAAEAVAGRQPDVAGDLAGAALARFRDAGLDAWARRAEGVLRAAGRRVPSRRTGAAGGGLTAREAEVLALVADGLSNRQIAARLVISEPTAASHVAHIFRKLGVSSRAEAVRVGAERGLLATPPRPGTASTTAGGAARPPR